MFSLLIVSGLFSKKKEDDSLLPPPPPFPGIEAFDAAEEARKLEKKSTEGKHPLDDKVVPEPSTPPPPKKEKKASLLSKKAEKKEKPKKKETKKRKKEKAEVNLAPEPAEEAPKPELSEPPELPEIRPESFHKEKAKHFLKKTGFVKSEEEKAMHEEHKEHFHEHKEHVNKKIQEERLEEESLPVEQEPKEKKSFFGALFGKKKQSNHEDDMDELDALDKELDKITGSVPPPMQMEAPLPEPSPTPAMDKPDIAHDVGQTDEMRFDQHEIAQAIEGAKKAEKKHEKKQKTKKPLFAKKEKPVVEEPIETPQVMPVETPHSDVTVDQIEEQIHQARLALMDFKFSEAKSIYVDVMKRYNDLPDGEKAHIYDDIKDLYYERKNAEKYASV